MSYQSLSVRRQSSVIITIVSTTRNWHLNGHLIHRLCTNTIHWAHAPVRMQRWLHCSPRVPFPAEAVPDHCTLHSEWKHGDWQKQIYTYLFRHKRQSTTMQMSTHEYWSYPIFTASLPDITIRKIMATDLDTNHSRELRLDLECLLNHLNHLQSLSPGSSCDQKWRRSPYHRERWWSPVQSCW